MPSRTRREILNAGTATLTSSGVTSASLDAELLLAHCTGCSRGALLAALNESVPHAVTARYRSLLQRRGAGEPLAYLTGEKEFFGRNFRVTKDTLIPRPATETLVTDVLAVLPRDYHGTIVDVGTGSGIIAITVACERPGADIIGMDNAAAALRVARQNVRRSGTSVRWQQSDLLKEVTERIDVVVANLPYLPAADAKNVSDAQRSLQYEPATALYSGADGTDHMRTLLHQAAERIPQPSLLWLEADPRNIGLIADVARREFPAARQRRLRDLEGFERVLRITNTTPG